MIIVEEELVGRDRYDKQGRWNTLGTLLIRVLRRKPFPGSVERGTGVAPPGPNHDQVCGLPGVLWCAILDRLPAAATAFGIPKASSLSLLRVRM